MADVFELGNNAKSVEVAPQFDAYSKVIINVGNNAQAVAGDDTGMTLEFDNPFGSKSMAERVLASLQGFRYSPYSANNALLDPAAEIGDAAATTTSYGGIYTRYRSFSALMAASIAAPTDKEIDHEYQYESPTEREFKRTVGEVRASIQLTNERITSEVYRLDEADGALSSRITQTADNLTLEVNRAKAAEASLNINADEIRATVSSKVSETGGSNSTFGWALTSSSHAWYSGNKKVMEITASGLMVSGYIEAKEGTIGGFNIGRSAIYNNLSEFGGTQTSGVYLGTNGIQLGQNFKVNSSGAVTASSLSLKGNITFLDADGNSVGTLTAANLKKQVSESFASVSPGGYCYGGAGGGYAFNNATTYGTGTYPAFLYCRHLIATQKISLAGYDVGIRTITYLDGDENVRTISVLAAQ